MIRPGMDQRLTVPTGLALARPNRIRMKTLIASPMGESMIVSDGEMMTLYQGRLKQYIQRPAPDRLTLADLPSSLSGQGEASWVLHLLLSDDLFETMLRGVEEVKEVGEETLEGVPVTVLRLLQSAGSIPSGIPRPERVDPWKKYAVSIRTRGGITWA